jgi:O-methyltransferase
LNKLRYLTASLKAIQTYRKFKDATMIERPQYIENLALAASATCSVPGSVVECGTWRGGMAAGLVETMGIDRHYFFFDSFEGLPEAKDVDGPAAIAYQADVTAETYRDNCRASLEDFSRVISRTAVPTSHCHTIKGFYETTLPKFDIASTEPIAVLRLDADWYDSTIICLRTFWASVAEGGIVLIDDYHTWAGCTKAVNEFFAASDPPQRISQGPIGRVSYVIKRGSVRGTVRPLKQSST